MRPLLEHEVSHFAQLSRFRAAFAAFAGASLLDGSPLIFDPGEIAPTTFSGGFAWALACLATQFAGVGVVACTACFEEEHHDDGC